MTVTTLVNGVDTEKVHGVAENIRQDAELGKAHFHVSNHWISGGHSRASIKDFYAARQTVNHKQVHRIEMDEPEMLAGKDEGANPVEALLSALSGCLTGAMVYHAALRGIEIDELECGVEGDLDLRGFLGISSEVRNGFSDIRVRFKVKTNEQNLDRLKALCRFSPVYDVTINGTNVDIQIDRKE
ncbi:MAG: OsmC family protein [Planctomycetaceae bacterium]|nr:OsmC family protein [Planctomycetaceae bacterium]